MKEFNLLINGRLNPGALTMMSSNRQRARPLRLAARGPPAAWTRGCRRRKPPRLVEAQRGGPPAKIMAMPTGSRPPRRAARLLTAEAGQTVT